MGYSTTSDNLIYDARDLLKEAKEKFNDNVLPTLLESANKIEEALNIKTSGHDGHTSERKKELIEIKRKLREIADGFLEVGNI